MLHRLMYLLVRRTHFWRHIGFAELAELYTSRMLRVMALQMMGGFALVYLLQLGYSLHFVAWFWFAYFFLRVLFAPLVAITVARYGPKHSTLMSNIGQVIAAVFLILAANPDFGFIALLLYMPFAGFSRSLYDVAYLVDFSKVKHVERAGRELGFMQIIERAVLALGPLLGGLIALAFGPQAMLAFGSLLMIMAALPLFFTGEPVRVKQKITLRHFNWKIAWKPAVANIASGVDVDLSGIMWAAFLAIVVLGGVQNSAVYAEIGALSSISIIVSIVVAYTYGKIVDNHQGKRLLKLSVLGDTLLHFLRPFVSTPVQALGANVANEVVTTGYTMPATRGIFDTADGLPGYRIVYMTIMGVSLVIGDCITMLVLASFTSFLSDTSALKMTYFTLAPLILLIMLHSTAVYRRGILTKFIHRV